jgi:hypothetical protein
LTWQEPHPSGDEGRGKTSIAPRGEGHRSTARASAGGDGAELTPEPETILYSRGRNTFDAYPEQRSAANFEAFADEILALPRAKTRDARTYICGPMRPNVEGRTHRGKADLLPRAWLALDLDGGSREDCDVLLLRLNGYQAAAWTTARHTPDCPRVRILVALDRLVDGPEGEKLGAAFVGVVGAGLNSLKWDRSTHHGEWECFLPMTNAEIMRYHGDPIDVDAVLATAPADPPRERPTTPDPYRALIIERGLLLRELGHGKDAITCPVAAEHSEATSDTATVYLWPLHGGYKWGHIDCKHAHCSDRRQEDYIRKLGVEPRDVWRAQAGGAAPYDSLPPSLEAYDDDSAREDARQQTADAKAPAAPAGNSEGMGTGEGITPRLSSTEPRIHHNRTVTLRELFEEPEESAQWLVEGLLPAAGFSVFAAKPKVGKSTLARQLALAVARGELFLGRETTQGPVLYVALEEKRAQVRAHFRAMGAGGGESIHIYVASAPENAIAWLSRQIELVHPVLVIIDPLFRFARVRDASAYAEVIAAMEPLLALARTTTAHVLVTHHATKRGEGADAILGSTAIFGSVDTAAVLVRTERYRSIATTQRYGEDLSETVLAWDPDTHTASLGGTREEAEIDRLGKEILAYLSDKKEPVTEALIDEQIEGRTGPKKKALRVLVRDKRVTRTGDGKRGEPFLYVSSSVVPTYTGEPGNQKPKDDLSDCASAGYSSSQDNADPGGSGNQQHGAKPDPGSWGTRI